MKVFLLIFLLLSSILLYAQEAIELDGKKIPKKELAPNKDYVVDLKKYKDVDSASKKATNEKRKVIYQKITVAKKHKAYAQTTTFKSIDAPHELPTSSLEFFDEKGNKKWEKNFKDKGPRYSYITNDGKYCIVNMAHFSNEPFDKKYSLCIFDDRGNEIFKDESPLKMQVSANRDLVLYQKDSLYTGNPNDIKAFYCYDVKNKKQWSKLFSEPVYFDPISLNGNYIIAYSDSTYTFYDRSGKQLFRKLVSFFEGYGISSISNDGKYGVSNRSSLTVPTSFEIYKIKDMSSINVLFADIETMTTHRLYNGAAFVNNSKYLVALTSIIAPATAMVVFHDIKGTYIGHKVYTNIPCSFYYPDITLMDDGSFEVYMDGYYLGNLVLPDVNTLKYLKN